MTRIRFKVLRAITFLLVALAGLLGLANAELEFYQDVEPKSPQVSLERLVRFLEAKSHRSPSLHESHHHQQQQQQLQHQQLEQLQLQQEQQQLEQLQLQQEQHKLEQLQLHRKQQRNHQQHLLELARQKQRGLLRDDLPERPNIIDVLQREAADPLEYVRELERQRLLPYLEYEPAPRIKPYSIEDEARARLLPAQLSKDPMLDYPETQYVDLERARQLENARRIEEAYRRRPEFTYAFDKPEAGGGRNNEAKSSPFAVAPNDLRYYEPGPFQRDRLEQSTDEAPLGHKQKPVEIMDVVPEDSSPEPSTPKPRPKQQTLLKTSKLNDEDLPDTSLVESSMLPEPQRRAEQDPLVVSVDNKVNNDIYFIAIVAGCSAAAMFALVLISLTWCRLQRVSKAAQDVEYPAYGVTGPNKDISPSGDQRLAQSAQMYHFQHQKQQIIAMENRASATRDPGSVSEAESDEENEEGDYTVYECPGLAPTGEMEVKNPLFHDDPTPATPAKSKKDDDEDDV